MSWVILNVGGGGLKPKGRMVGKPYDDLERTIALWLWQEVTERDRRASHARTLTVVSLMGGSLKVPGNASVADIVHISYAPNHIQPLLLLNIDTSNAHRSSHGTVTDLRSALNIPRTPSQAKGPL